MGFKNLVRVHRAGKMEERRIIIEKFKSEGVNCLSKKEHAKYTELCKKNAKDKMREQIDHEKATQATSNTKTISTTNTHNTEIIGAKVQEINAVKISKSKPQKSKK